MNKTFFKQALTKIIQTDSPSGYTREVMQIIEAYAKEFGFPFEWNQKGGGIITVEADSSEVIGLSAHIDTLGAMVRSINDQGHLQFTIVGGPSVPSLDSEYCTIMTREGKRFTGTFLSKSPAVHVYSDTKTRPRDCENMYIRLDADVTNKKDTLALGISPGDFVFFDPKLTFVDDYIKTRFLDDKASVACLLAILKEISEGKWKPKHTLKFLFSNYEEVGHGLSYLPADVTKVLAVDMGCIGEDLSCTEKDVSICAKDSSGPYDYDMITEMVQLSKKHSIPYAVDIYPYYGSDASAALRGGHNIKAALIGPGVHASHGVERTHMSAIKATIDLLRAYLS